MRQDSRVPAVLDPVWIPLSDGCRLAARLWLPEDGRGRPCPVILEAIPYRRTDGTLAIDQPRYEWWAQRGFAGLQIAARRPEALRAVVTVNSTVRRYTDDCHYIGGSVNAHDMLSWATTMLAFDARPPDPAVVGERWREMWERRLDVAPPMIEHWLSHQLEDAYWRHGSVGFDLAAIGCPVLAVGGWADPYRNAVLALLEGMGERCRGLIGPWAHGYPHDTGPGPQIGFLDECARFFGHHLRGDDNGYERLPALRAYVQDYDPPAAQHLTRRGQWVGVQWPPPPGEAATVTLALGARTLSAPGAQSSPGAQSVPGAESPPAPLSIGSAQANGLTAGSWCPYGGPTEPGDQRPDDALSLCFDSGPLAEPLAILGFPRLRVRVSADRPRAVLAVRLCDVAPTGESLLVTRGVLNLTHRHGHDRADPLVPGEWVDVALTLDCAGHRFAAGHRIRVSVSPTYWPWVWPAPEPVTLTVAAAASALELPALDAHADPDAELPSPEVTTPLEVRWITQSPFRQSILHDLSAGSIELRSQPDFLAGGWWTWGWRPRTGARTCIASRRGARCRPRWSAVAGPAWAGTGGRRGSRPTPGCAPRPPSTSSTPSCAPSPAAS